MRVGVVPKTNNEIYVSISVGKYIIPFHLFSVLCQRRLCCWKYRKWGSHVKNRYLCKGGKKCEDKFLNQSLLHPAIFWKKELAALWMCEAIGIETLPIPQWTFTCFLKSGYKNTQTRCKVFWNLPSVTQQLIFVLLKMLI